MKLFSALISTLLLVSFVHAEDWPQWRGPSGQGHAKATGLPATWSETEHVVWKTAIPGRGWSSPVIAGDQIWVTTAIETAAKPEDATRRTKSNTGNQPLTVLESVSLRAVCIDRRTGRVLDNVELLNEKEPQWVHRLNSYASPTPVLENGRLYAHFGTFGTACLDTKSGKVIWANRDLKLIHENGPGSSPVVSGDFVIFHCDGSDVQYIAGLDKRTGKLAWKTPRSGAMNANPQLKKAYGTPLIAEFAGKSELLSPAADWLYSYEPTTGKELWKLKYEVLGFSIVPRPVTGHGMLYFSTSFMKSEMLAVRYDGTQPPQIAWRYKKGAPQMPSPILVDDALYFVTDSGGIVTCLDAKTGEERWRERLGGEFSASPLFADGKLYFPSRDGFTAVLAPGKEFKLLAKNTLDSGHFASPAAVDGAFYLRTEKSLYRIERKPAKTAAR